MTSSTGVDQSWLYTLPTRFQVPAYPIGGTVPATQAPSSSSGAGAGIRGEAAGPASPRPSSSHLSIVDNGLGGPKGYRMTGQIYVRCTQCGDLAYDPRTGRCTTEEQKDETR